MEPFVELTKAAVDGLETEKIAQGVVEAAQEIRTTLQEGAEEIGVAPETLERKGRALEQDDGDIEVEIFEGRDPDRAGGLAACSYKCIMSHCYPVNIAKGINSKNPNPANSALGHR